MYRFRLVMFVLLLTGSAALCAQTAPPPFDPHHVDGSEVGGLLSLSRSWLVTAGDDSHYADPSFDDSAWKILPAGQPLSSVGIDYSEWVWYRQHVAIPPGRRNMALLIRQFGGSYQLFVNGTEVGNSGPQPAGGSTVSNSDNVHAVPDAAVASGNVVLAIRAHVRRRMRTGTGPVGFWEGSALYLGPARVVHSYASLWMFRNYTSNIMIVLAEALVGVIALALAFAMRQEKEYLALALACVASAVADAQSVWVAAQNQFESAPAFFVQSVVRGVATIAMLEFFRIVLGLKRNRWWAGYEWLIGVVSLFIIPWVTYSMFLGTNGVSSGLLLVIQAIAQVVSLPVAAGLPALALFIWWKHRNADALLLFIPFFLQSVIQYINFALALLHTAHVTTLAILPQVPTATFNMQWSEVADFVFSVALLIFLVLRTVRIARSRAAMASDLHAVQSVQEILLARASHDTPGFRVEHVYHPAQEVGGDFFLVSPGPDGSLTAVLGDVSGKGLVAAMRVSMILGVLRREEHREPEAILRNLNEALLLQGDMGFTTACAVRLQADGQYTIANAGQISPYVGGMEIETPSSLPLGMQPDQQYEQVEGFLPEGKALVLMSDGVVEAKNAKGELYGFERLPQLTLMAAEDIADVARRYGQEDDITVMTLVREAA